MECPGLLFICVIFSFANAQTTQEDALRKDVYFLSSNDLDGRGVGTRGLDRAADYIAQRFKSAGLSVLPKCPEEFDRFTMSAPASASADTSLVSDNTKFAINQDFVPMGFSPDARFTAPIVFAGYGVADSKNHYDDYTGVDVAGKVVLIFRFEPHDARGGSRFSTDGEFTSAALFNSKAKIAAEHGAIAVLFVNPPQFHGEDSFIPMSRAGAESKIPFVQISQHVADGLLARGGSGQTLAALQTMIDQSGEPHSFALRDISISGNVRIDRKTINVENVIAYLPGKTHADEFVVIGAHYDHLGREKAIGKSSDEIYHGADDNASGCAALMSIADHISRESLDRSILFVCFTGEESGLVGSSHFVENPPVELGKIVAMLNLDMVGRVRNQMLFVGGDGTADAFEPMLKSADENSPLQIQSIGKGGFGPTDHEAFARKHIPVLFLFSGMHADYHRPTDIAGKINFDGLAQVVEFSTRLTRSLAQMPRQQYIDRYDSQGLAILSSSNPMTMVVLGIVPDFGSDESSSGIEVASVSADSPAQRAGIRDGDRLIQIDRARIRNLYDLNHFLASAKAGQDIQIILERANTKIEVHATLEQRKD